jgi:hypothetical protein
MVPRHESTLGNLRSTLVGSHQLVFKPQHAQQLERGQGCLKLRWFELSVVEPLLNRFTLDPSVFLEKLSGVVNRHPRLFLADDFHNAVPQCCTAKCAELAPKGRFGSLCWVILCSHYSSRSRVCQPILKPGSQET